MLTLFLPFANLSLVNFHSATLLVGSQSKKLQFRSTYSVKIFIWASTSGIISRIKQETTSLTT